MSITQIMVGFAICIIVIVLTLFVGLFIDAIADTDQLFGSWMLSSLGFGICLTIVLYQNGIFR